jgi:hypothetical protein
MMIMNRYIMRERRGEAGGPPPSRTAHGLRDRRGQFVIAAALLISMLTLSVALSIHQLSLQRQHLSYEPVEELVLGITSDLDRCLAHALSRASEVYYTSGSREMAEREGRAFISKWVKSVMASYSSHGIGLAMNSSSGSGGKLNVDFTLSWGNGTGLSQVYTEFRLDLASYGFRGWVGHSGKYVRLSTSPELIHCSEGSQGGEGSTSVVFSLVEGKDAAQQPVTGLMGEDITVWVNLTRTSMVQGNITGLRYLGMGHYNVTFTPKVNNNTMGLSLMVRTPKDRVYVAAYIPYRDIYVTLRSQLESSDTPTDEGWIRFGDNSYRPSTEPHAIDPGQYILWYTPENEGYRFLNWTVTGQASVDDPHSNVTRVVIYGNATIKAYYAVYTPPQPPPEPGLTVNLNSIEEDGETQNLGLIRLGEALFPLPNSTSIAGGVYTLEYTPETGYSFTHWTTSGEITVEDPNSTSTRAIVAGNGSITAHYRAIRIRLRSRHINNQLQENLGTIALDGEVYSLPQLLRILSGEHPVRYNPHNSSYTFIRWESDGGVTPHNSTGQETQITATNDGNLTAVYDLVPSLPPQSDDWSTLYVDTGYALNPISMCSNSSGKLTPPFSHGEEKQEAILESPETPYKITLDDNVRVIIHLRPDPPSSVKSINITLSFRYNGTTYTIGENSTNINSQGVYELIIDATSGQYPNNNQKQIPEKSVIVMNILINLEGPPYGTLFFYYGPDKPSKVILYSSTTPS